MMDFKSADLPEDTPRIDAKEAAFELATLLSKPVLVTETRINPDSLPAGLYAYELGHSETNANQPVSLQKHTSSSFFGAIVSDAPFELTQTRYSCANYDERLYQSIGAGDFVPDGFTPLTLEQYSQGDYELIPNTKKDIRVVIVEPMKAPYEAVVPNTLGAHQKLVGGYIETIRPFDDDVILICNEEGKLNGLPLNRRIKHDIIAGTFFLCGDNQAGDFASLTDEQVKKYINKFSAIELYVGMKQNPRHEPKHRTGYAR